MKEINFNDLPAEIKIKIMNINKKREREERELERMKTCRCCGEHADNVLWGPQGDNICEDCYDNYGEETGEYNPNAL